MQKFESWIVNLVGQPVNSATVDVYNTGTTTHPAAIYSDNGITVTANPLTTDANGHFQFWAPNGTYDIKVSGAGITTFTRSGVELFDAPGTTGSGNVVLATSPTLVTPTLTTPTINAGVCIADPVAALGVVTKQYADTLRVNRLVSTSVTGGSITTTASSAESSGWGLGPITPNRIASININVRCNPVNNTAGQYVVIHIRRNTTGIPALHGSVGTDLLIPGSEAFIYSSSNNISPAPIHIEVDDTSVVLGTAYYYYVAWSVLTGTTGTLDGSANRAYFRVREQ
jgi:hypothetical protein